MLVCVISKVLCSLASDCDPERGSIEIMSVRAQKIDCDFWLTRRKSKGDADLCGCGKHSDESVTDRYGGVHQTAATIDENRNFTLFCILCLIFHCHSQSKFSFAETLRTRCCAFGV